MKKFVAILLSIILISGVLSINASAESNSFTYDDLSYGTAGERNLLDLYLPENTQGEVGLVMYIHGGSWIAGDKTGYKTKLEEMCSKGYAAAAINYRYAALDTSLDDILDDVTSALTKIKSTAAENGIEINRCMIIGDSAGAHITLMYAYTRADEAPIEVACVRGNSTPADLTLDRYAGSENTLLEISCVTGVAKLGYIITPDNVDETAVQYYLLKYSPVSYASSAVPTILCHGSQDDGVPIEGAIKMYQQLVLANVPAEGVVYPNSGHGLEADPDCAERADELTEEYLERYLAPSQDEPLPESNPYIMKDVSYGSAGERNLLDLYLPENYTGEVGLVLYIHGGGWIYGSKADYDYCAETVQRGYAAATINYRYAAMDVSIWDILDDVTAALAKIKELAAEKGITINKCMLSGFSAGGHISLMYAYTRASSAPITPVAVVSKSGPTDLTDKAYKNSSTIMTALSAVSGTTDYGVLINSSNFDQAAVQYLLLQASPINYVSTAVPTIFCHGTNDSIVPYTNGITLLQKIDPTGVPYVPITFQNSEHGLENDPAASAYAQQCIENYEKTYLGSPAYVKPDDGKKYFVSIGDSPADDDVNDVYGKIVSDRRGYEFIDDSVSGSTSSELLSRLTDCTRSDYCAKDVVYADVVCISIGGNDYLSDSEIAAAIPQQNTIPLYAALNKENPALTSALTENITAIISIIKQLNPDAVILFQNVYNPNFSKTTMRNTYNIGINAINAAIDGANDGSYYVVDINSAVDDAALVDGDGIHLNENGNSAAADIIDGFLADLYNENVISVNEGTDAVIDEENKLIYGFTAGRSSAFDYVTVADGYTCEDCAVATDNKLNIYKGDELAAVYTLVLFGDVNGDGRCDGQDAVLVGCMSFGMMTADKAQIMAADCNHDGTIDSVDKELLEKAGMLLESFDQSKSEEELSASSAYAEYLNLIPQTSETEEAEESVGFSFFEMIMQLVSRLVNYIRISLVILNPRG